MTVTSRSTTVTEPEPAISTTVDAVTVGVCVTGHTRELATNIIYRHHAHQVEFITLMTHITKITFYTSHTRLASHQTHHTFDGVMLLFLEKKETLGRRDRLREWKMREGGERESAPQARVVT